MSDIVKSRGDVVQTAGATKSTQLEDMPSSLSGEALKFIRVNALETDYEFVVGGGGGVSTFQALTDAFLFPGNAKKLAFVNDGETALEPTSELFWNEVNKRLGVGAPAGSRRLEVFQASQTAPIQVRGNGTVYVGLGFRESVNSGSDMGFIGIKRTDSPSSSDSELHFRHSKGGVVSTSLMADTAGNIGVKILDPIALLHVGEAFASIASITAQTAIVSDLNGISSLHLENKSASPNAEMRFITRSDDGNYLAFTAPGSGNTGTFFGEPKSGGNFLFSTARPLFIGTILDDDINFGYGNDTIAVTIQGGTGFLGVLTTNPDKPLEVNGVIRTGTPTNFLDTSKETQSNSQVAIFESPGGSGGFNGGFEFIGGTNNVLATVGTFRIYTNSTTVPGSVFVGNVSELSAQLGAATTHFGILNKFATAGTFDAGTQMHPAALLGDYSFANGKHYGLYIGGNGTVFNPFDANTQFGVFFAYQNQPITNGFGSSAIIFAKDEAGSGEVEVMRFLGRHGVSDPRAGILEKEPKATYVVGTGGTTRFGHNDDDLTGADHQTTGGMSSDGELIHNKQLVFTGLATLVSSLVIPKLTLTNNMADEGEVITFAADSNEFFSMSTSGILTTQQDMDKFTGAFEFHLDSSSGSVDSVNIWGEVKLPATSVWLPVDPSLRRFTVSSSQHGNDSFEASQTGAIASGTQFRIKIGRDGNSGTIEIIPPVSLAFADFTIAGNSSKFRIQ